MKNLLLFLIFFLVSNLVSCIPHYQSIPGEDYKPDVAQPSTELSNAPPWVKSPGMEGGLSAIGISKIGAAGVSFAMTNAIAAARDELARSMEVKVKNLVKNFTEVTGVLDNESVDKVATQTSRQAASQALIGSKHRDTWISPSGQLYVLVVIDSNTLKQSAKTASISSLKNDNAAWQKFQAKKAFEELDREIEKQFGNFR